MLLFSIKMNIFYSGKLIRLSGYLKMQIQYFKVV